MKVDFEKFTYYAFKVNIKIDQILEIIPPYTELHMIEFRELLRLVEIFNANCLKRDWRFDTKLYKTIKKELKRADRYGVDSSVIEQLVFSLQRVDRPLSTESQLFDIIYVKAVQVIDEFSSTLPIPAQRYLHLNTAEKDSSLDTEEVFISRLLSFKPGLEERYRAIYSLLEILQVRVDMERWKMCYLFSRARQESIYKDGLQWVSITDLLDILQYGYVHNPTWLLLHEGEEQYHKMISEARAAQPQLKS